MGGNITGSSFFPIICSRIKQTLLKLHPEEMRMMTPVDALFLWIQAGDRRERRKLFLKGVLRDGKQKENRRTPEGIEGQAD
jgi:hypothetical protein